MPGYTPSRQVTHYFVQQDDRHPASSSRSPIWRTVGQFTDNPEAATAKAKAVRAQGHKVRVVKRAGVSGGYTSL